MHGKVHTEEPKAISAFAVGMTVIFSQGDYCATVILVHIHIGKIRYWWCISMVLALIFQ